MTPDHGHLRVRGRRFFFEDGTLFFPRGLSLMGVTHLESLDEFTRLWKLSPEAWFDRLQAAGVNFLRTHVYASRGATRFWPVPECVPEHARLLEKNLSWYLEQCERRGIHVCLSLSHFGEFKPFERHPYHVSNGGPCRTLRDVVTMPAARALFKRRIDFYASFARFRSFGMWEPTNELWSDPPTVSIGKDHATADWVIEICRHCREVDPFHHPVGTNLLGNDNPGDPQFQAVQGSNAVDWISVHTYNDNFLQQVRHPFVVGTGKPVLGTEGFDMPGPCFEWFRHRTWEGIALFTASLEWSDGYIIENHPMGRDLRIYFDDVLRYLAAVAAVLRETVEADVWGDPYACDVPGAASASTDGRHLMAYFRHTQTGQPVKVGLEVGAYELRWYDCETGRRVRTETVNPETPGVSRFLNCQMFVKTTAPGSQCFLYARPVAGAAVNAP